MLGLSEGVVYAQWQLVVTLRLKSGKDQKRGGMIEPTTFNHAYPVAT